MLCSSFQLVSRFRFAVSGDTDVLDSDQGAGFLLLLLIFIVIILGRNMQIIACLSVSNLLR